MQYYGQYEQEQKYCSNEENIQISLHNQDLWNQFHSITNEMIVTKVGRRMFPIIAINIRGLDPEKMYTVELSFDQIDSHRWRFVSSQWQPGMKPDAVTQRPPYQHPDSPNYGRTWMKDIVAFPKVKLTNKLENIGPSQVLLNSLHKYRPRISIIDVMSKEKIYEISFDETEFIAVTAYQSEEVKALKVRYNPFAKAFRELDNGKREPVEEETNHIPRFNTQESSSGGPDRIKRESYRTSPYNYSQRKLSPTNVSPYPSTSTSPFDVSTYYTPSQMTHTPSSSSTLLLDNTAYYSNSYYSSPSSYYFPHGAVTPYPFMPSFGYPLNNNSSLETASFLHMQPPMATTSADHNYLTPSLLPTSTDLPEY